MSTAFWNQRYTDHDLVYGEAPNEFLSSVANLLPAQGAALDIGAGEGRNALFLASRGLDVLAVDQSRVGLQKAEKLARERGLKLRTQAADLRDFEAAPASLDVITSIFVHLPASIRAPLHHRIARWLKPGGLYILEVYAPEQLTRKTGGPPDPNVYAPLSTFLDELRSFTIEHQAALVRPVVEGPTHTGDADVIQTVARKV
jgi:2-polyprenyl-3-methyl-5-hydroxy-6-metoxy-1,4-benzoquinol methylase